MSRQWIKELQIGQSVQLEVCIHRSEVYKTRYGEDYLSLTLGDRTGKIAAKRFGPSPAECEALASLRFARIRGQVELYGERRQIRLTRPLENLGTPDDLQDFFASAPLPLSEMEARLQRHIDSVQDLRLNALLRAIFLEDPKFAAAFFQFPAALEYHHAFRHGLLQHSLEVADIVAAVAERQIHWGGRPIRRDLAVTGALLHDIGKVEEMDQQDLVFDFTDAGNLLGHVLLGSVFIARKIARLRQSGLVFPKPLENHLLHLVTAHHGQGSPKDPTTPEAVLIHSADKTSIDLYYIEEARAEAAAGQTFARQWKLQNSYGGTGRFVFVGDIDEAPPEAAPEPPVVPAPLKPRLPVLRLITDTEARQGVWRTRVLPIYGRIAAGAPLLHSDCQQGEARIEAAALGSGQGDYYLLRVRGDSMIGHGIEDGDLIVVRHQVYADYGDLIVALLDEEGATVKRLVRKNGAVFLVSSNPAYPPIPVSDPDTLRIQGRVIGIARS